MNVSLCDNAFDIIEIDDLFDGKYKFPLTVDEYRRYLLLNGLNTDIVDFYEDCKQYKRLYSEWKARKKRAKLEQAEIEEQQDIASTAVLEGHIGNTESSMPASQSDLHQIRESGSALNLGNSVDEIEIYTDRSTEKSTEKSTERSEKTERRLKTTMSSRLTGASLPTAPSQEHLMRTHESNKAEKEKKLSSKTISNMAIKIFKKYLMTDAEKYLFMLPDKSVSPITSHYIKAIETADKTGLRFIPSPERAFHYLLKLCRQFMWDEDDYFSSFINYCVGNTVPSSLPNSFYQYRSSVSIISYVQTVLFAVLAACVILMKVYSNISRWWLSFLTIPLFLMVSNYLLATRHIGFWLWLQGKRETIILRTINNISLEDGKKDEQVIVLLQMNGNNNNAPEEGVKLAPNENVKIEIRKPEDPLLQKLQNGLVVRILALALSTSLLITAVFVFLWPDDQA